MKLSLPDIPLKGGDSKQMMRFDIGAKASVPDEGDSVLFFELRHKIKGKEQASSGQARPCSHPSSSDACVHLPEQGPKYWTCQLTSTMSKGRHQLQVVCVAGDSSPHATRAASSPAPLTCCMAHLIFQLYKAPVEYALTRQKRQPKENCHQILQVH